MNYVLAFAVLSLFTPFKLKLSLLQLRPFDALSIILAFLVAVRWNRLQSGQRWIGFLGILPYFVWHAISAFMYTTDSGIRETAQVLLISLFSFSVVSIMPELNYKLIGKLLLVGLSIIMAVNVAYHVSIGVYTGWKRLIDPKAAFDFLPVVLGAIIMFTPPQKRFWLHIGWLVLGVLILLSGERKGLVGYGLLTLLSFVRGGVSPLRFMTVAAAGIVCLVIATSMNPYVARQLDTLINPTSGSSNDFQFVLRGETPTSLSNAARMFTVYVSNQMLQGHWLLGNGTNAYLDRVRSEFPMLPNYMLAGIHGEFQRILVENGLLGLALYLAVWIMGVVRFVLMVTAARRAGWLNAQQALLLPPLLVVPSLLYVSFEANGTHSFVVLLLVSASADFLRYAVRPKTAPDQSRAVRAPVGWRRAAASSPLRTP